MCVQTLLTSPCPATACHAWQRAAVTQARPRWGQDLRALLSDFKDLSLPSSQLLAQQPLFRDKGIYIWLWNLLGSILVTAWNSKELISRAVPCTGETVNQLRPSSSLIPLNDLFWPQHKNSGTVSLNHSMGRVMSSKIWLRKNYQILPTQKSPWVLPLLWTWFPFLALHHLSSFGEGSPRAALQSGGHWEFKVGYWTWSRWPANMNSIIHSFICSLFNLLSTFFTGTMLMGF